MCLRAAIRSPLRSKRAMSSPVRPRSNASGLTRISVLSIDLLSWGLRLGVGRGGLLDRGVRGAYRTRRGSGSAPVPWAAGLRGGLSDFGLAVGADLPARVERL